MNPFSDLMQKAFSIKIGESMSFDSAIIPDDTNVEKIEDWKQLVRYLESEGLVVCAATKSIPEGTYITEGLTENRTLKGWNLENSTPTALLIKNLGWAFHSKKPEAPNVKEIGLKLKPHYTMAVMMGNKKTGWGKMMYLPSGGFSLMIADTSGIQYGQSAFEGACAMRNEKKEVFGFRLDQNAHRFTESIESLDLPVPNEEIIKDAIEKTITYNAEYVPNNGEGKLYIRPSVSGLSGGLGVIVPDYFIISIEIAAFGDYLPASIKVEGRKDVFRPSTGSTKIAPNYGGSYRIKHGVKARGFDDYLSFDANGNTEEVATCAAGFLDANGAFVFPPVRNEIDNLPRNILPSITRKSTIELLKKHGETVIVRDIHFSELKDMKCMFTMGNAVGILYVSEICLKNDENDIGETIQYTDETARDTIYSIKEKLYSARVGNLPGFEHWVKKLA